MILLLGIMMLTGCKIRNYSSALIDINNGEDKITLGYANFVFKYNQARYDVDYGEMYGQKLWTEDMTGSGQTFTEELKQDVVDTLETQYVIKKHADEYNVTLSDEDKTKVDDTVKKFMDENSKSALNSLGADEDVVKELLTNMVYVSKMEQAMIEKGKASGEINEANTSSSYLSNQLENWKNEVEFTVDDALLAQITVGDLYQAQGGNSTKANTTNSSKGK